MKISVIITTMLVAQVSASFFDVFHGAVLSVQNSFGKLLSDVVTDVKETVDCTILAVEHILSLSPDATTRYYDKCGSVNNKTDSVSEPRQDASAPKVEVTLNLPNNSEYLHKAIPEIDARINETLSKVLGNYKPHDNVPSIENVLAKESERLAGVSVLVKKELGKLSHEVTTKQRDSEPSVDTILQEIKVLEKREQNTKNTSEAREIHQVIDQVLGKLHAIEVTEDNENIKLEEILKDLRSNSNNSFVGLRHQFEEWKEEESRHLREIKSKIEEHEKISGSKHPAIFNIDKNRDDVEPIKNFQEISADTTTQGKETPDNSTSSRTIGDSNDKSLISVANESSTQNRMNESEPNVTVIVSSSFSTTENSLEIATMHPFESSSAVGSSELATLSTNQSTILQNNLSRNDTNQTVTNITLGVVNIASVNETIPSVDLVADLDKLESMTVTANEPTTILYKNENNLNETVTVSDPLHTPEITAIKDVILPVKRNTDSGKEKSSDCATNNNNVIISAAETVEADTTSTSQSNNNSNDTVISSTASAMVENTSVNATSSENVESSTSATNKLVTTLVKFDLIASNDTMLTSTSSSINMTTSVNVTILPTESSTATVNEESLTVTAKISGNDNDSNNTMLPSTSSPKIDSTPISETVQPEENILASGKDQSTTELYDAKTTSTSLPTVENTPVSVTVQPKETGTTSDNEKSSTVTTKIVNGNDSNNTMITSDYSPIVENKSVIGTVEPEETTTISGNEEFSNDSNGTMITSTSLPIIESTFVNKTIQPNKTTTASSNKKFLTETTSELTTTSKIVNKCDTTITSTPTPIISTSESETIQDIDLTKVTSDEESLGSTANSSTETPNAANDDNDSSAAVETTPRTISESIPQVNVITSTPTPIISTSESESIQDIDLTKVSTSDEESSETPIAANDDNDSIAAMVTMTPGTISESIPQENVTAAENDETLASTTNSPIASQATVINTDSNIDAVTSTAIPAAEITTVSGIIEPVESTTSIKNLEPSVLSTVPVTIPIIVTTRTVSPPTERIPTSESVRASKNEEDLNKLPTLKANASRTQEILNSPDLNFMVRSSPLTITESPTINRQWLSPNTRNQLNYNTNGAPRNNYEFNAPISLSDRLPQTKQPLNNPEVPMYDQAVPPITRSLFDGAPMLLTPDSLIPNDINQQRKIESEAIEQAAFKFFDSIDERLSHSESPFGPEEDILKIANTPPTPLITNAPRKPIDPQRMNYEKPSYAPRSKHPTDPPYSVGDRAPVNTYRPQGLTTHRPKKTTARANNYKSPSMDYDSFLHTPPRNSEAHQRALKEALQLIAKSKRAERIINSIMKNKNKFNARSAFG